MSSDVEVTNTYSKINYERTLKNVYELFQDPEFAFIFKLTEDTLDEVIDEFIEFPSSEIDFENSTLNTESIQELEDAIDSRGVFMMLGFYSGMENHYANYDFGVKVGKDENGNYEITYGTTSSYGVFVGNFISFKDKNDADDHYDIVSKACLAAIDLMDSLLVVEK